MIPTGGPPVSVPARAICHLIIVLPLCLLLVSCPGSQNSRGVRAVIQDKGSDTMVNLAQAWAEAYKLVDPAVEVEVSGGGSGVGIAALTKGAVDLANASRNMKPEEIALAKANTGLTPREFVVAYDALAIIVHKDNPLNEISFDELARIYVEGATLTRWSQLGVRMPSGRDEIIRVGRQSSSGTYEFLRERVLKKKDFGLGSLDLNGSKEVVDLVASTPGAIAYSGMGYATSAVKMLKVRERPGRPAYAPTVENTVRRTYPIARSLQVYTLGEPRGAVRRYVEWLLGEAGQRLVVESGYVPAPKPGRAGGKGR